MTRKGQALDKIIAGLGEAEVVLADSQTDRQVWKSQGIAEAWKADTITG